MRAIQPIAIPTDPLTGLPRHVFVTRLYMDEDRIQINCEIHFLDPSEESISNKRLRPYEVMLTVDNSTYVKVMLIDGIPTVVYTDENDPEGTPEHAWVCYALGAGANVIDIITAGVQRVAVAPLFRFDV